MNKFFEYLDNRDIKRIPEIELALRKRWLHIAFEACVGEISTGEQTILDDITNELQNIHNTQEWLRKVIMLIKVIYNPLTDLEPVEIGGFTSWSFHNSDDVSDIFVTYKLTTGVCNIKHIDKGVEFEENLKFSVEGAYNAFDFVELLKNHFNVTFTLC